MKHSHYIKKGCGSTFLEYYIFFADGNEDGEVIITYPTDNVIENARAEGVMTIRQKG